MDDFNVVSNRDFLTIINGPYLLSTLICVSPLVAGKLYY
jgi:hypothetical protein